VLRAESGPFDPPTRVRVLRLQSSCDQPLAEIGRGTLIDRLAVGEHFRVAVDGQPTLTTTAVRRLEHHGDKVVEIETINSVYRLERECADTEANCRKGITGTVRRLSQLVLRARLRAAGHSSRDDGKRSSARDEPDHTQSVSLASAPSPGAGPFHSGVAIRVTRIRGGDRLGSERGDLGSALLLDDLAMGEPARFSLESGATIVTSPVRGVERIGARAVQLVTRNSTYRFELIAPSD
jgi:hypothetical protein